MAVRNDLKYAIIEDSTGKVCQMMGSEPAQIPAGCTLVEPTLFDFEDGCPGVVYDPATKVVSTDGPAATAAKQQRIKAALIVAYRDRAAIEQAAADTQIDFSAELAKIDAKTAALSSEYDAI
jgi:hypothetical protein